MTLSDFDKVCPGRLCACVCVRCQQLGKSHFIFIWLCTLHLGWFQHHPSRPLSRGSPSHSHTRLPFTLPLSFLYLLLSQLVFTGLFRLFVHVISIACLRLSIVSTPSLVSEIYYL